MAQTLKHLFSQHLTRPVCPGVCPKIIAQSVHSLEPSDPPAYNSHFILCLYITAGSLGD